MGSGIRFSWEFLVQCYMVSGTIILKDLVARHKLQYSSQIVETDTISLEFSGKILRFILHTVFLTDMCLLPSQC